MKNIAIKAIVALLLVVSLGYSRDMNCRSEWFPMVKELAPEFPWDMQGASKIKTKPSSFLCGVFHSPDGLPVYAAIEKKFNGDFLLVQRNDTGWETTLLSISIQKFDDGEPRMFVFIVDGYGIESANYRPYSDYLEGRRLVIDLIAKDDSRPESWRKTSDTPQEVPKVKGASRGLAGDCPDSWRDSYGLCKREWFN